MRSLKKADRGFTLVELMIAMTVLVVALCGLLLLFNYCYILSTQAGNITIAASEVVDKMEEIRLHEFANITADYDNTQFNLTQLNGTGTVDAAYVNGTNSSLVEVSLNVTWQERANRTQSFPMTTIIANKES